MAPTTLGTLAAALLAQLPKSNPPAPLPAGPFFERLLFEQPFGIATGLVVAALVAFVALNRDGKARAGAMAAGTLMVLAIGAYLLSKTVRTPRERIADATRALVTVTAKADTRAMDPFLAPDVRFSTRYHVPGQNFPEGGIDKEGLLNAVSQAFGRYPIKDHSVKEVQSSIDGPNSGRTQVKVWVQLDMGIPNTSWWLIRWRKDADGEWRAVTVEPLDIPMLGSSE